jgi:hypothetical protein
VLHKCGKPACPSLFRSLNLGKLFLLDTDSSVAGASGTSPVNRRGRSVRQVDRGSLDDDQKARPSVCANCIGRGRLATAFDTRGSS